MNIWTIQWIFELFNEYSNYLMDISNYLANIANYSKNISLESTNEYSNRNVEFLFSKSEY